QHRCVAKIWLTTNGGSGAKPPREKLLHPSRPVVPQLNPKGSKRRPTHSTALTTPIEQQEPLAPVDERFYPASAATILTRKPHAAAVWRKTPAAQGNEKGLLSEHVDLRVVGWDPQTDGR